MTKEYFIKKVSKIEQTLEDEFKAEFNSPELLWDNFLTNELFEFAKIFDFLENNYTKIGDQYLRNKDGEIANSKSILEDYFKEGVK
jgi:hypothetical protein